MTTDDPVYTAKRASILEILQRMGCHSQRVHGDRHYYFCPFHDDKKKANLLVTLHNNTWYCFSCGIGGDTISLVGRFLFGSNFDTKGPDFKKVLSWINKSDYSQIQFSDVKTREAPPIEDFRLYQRNLSRISISYLKKRLGCWTKYEFGEASIGGYRMVLMPLIVGNKLRALKGRFVDHPTDRYYIYEGSDCSIPHFINKGTSKVIMTEDSWSAMTASDITGYSAVSLFTGNTISSKSKPLFDSLLKGKQVTLIPDSDISGQKLVDCCDFANKILKLPAPFKDLNDFFMADRASCYKWLVSNA